MNCSSPSGRLLSADLGGSFSRQARLLGGDSFAFGFLPGEERRALVLQTGQGLARRLELNLVGRVLRGQADPLRLRGVDCGYSGLLG